MKARALHLPKPDGRRGKDLRLAALVRFAIAITAFTILGHTVLGFEQSVLQVFVSLGAAYFTELALEAVHAAATRRRPRFFGGLKPLAAFLLPAHISGLAIGMLLYPNERLLPFAFAAATAIASKSIFRVSVAGRSRHFMNPSNTGITTTLLLFPWVGIAPPYQFTENLYDRWDAVVPMMLIVAGCFLNALYTRRMPLIAAWLAAFALQALLRSLLLGIPLTPPFLPMTGMAFLLFTFYMVSDPGTTPVDARGQIAFGASVAAVYGLLMVSHVVFGLFFALTAVCAVRGVLLYLQSLREARAAVAAPETRAAKLPVVARAVAEEPR